MPKNMVEMNDAILQLADECFTNAVEEALRDRIFEALENMEEAERT